jgi:hypothetical protein
VLILDLRSDPIAARVANVQYSQNFQFLKILSFHDFCYRFKSFNKSCAQGTCFNSVGFVRCPCEDVKYGIFGKMFSKCLYRKGEGGQDYGLGLFRIDMGY